MRYVKEYIMCKACEVGKIVVNKCLKNNIFINTQKLQKLLVLMQIEYAKKTSRSLFSEDVVIWDCGVAIKEVDAEFRSNAVEFTDLQIEYIALLEAEEECVNYVIDNYGELSAYEINKLPEVQTLISIEREPAASGVIHISADSLQEYYKKK